MRKLTLLHLYLGLFAGFHLSSCATARHEQAASLSRGLRGTPQTITSTSGPGEAAASAPRFQHSTRSDFARLIVGGTVLQDESGEIVVQSNTSEAGLQPAALTADAIITSSFMSRVAKQPEFRAAALEARSNEGVVSIHSRDASIETAAKVINMALTIPDVRKVIYLMPTSV